MLTMQDQHTLSPAHADNEAALGEDEATDPVSAREGVPKPANPNIPNSAATAICSLLLLIISPPRAEVLMRPDARLWSAEALAPLI